MAKYNGIELPDLPQYDASAYPRAYICQVVDASAIVDLGQCMLCLVDGAAAIAHSNDEYGEDAGVILFAGVTAVKSYSYRSSDDEWTETDPGWSDYTCILLPEILDPIWSNFDILAADGSVYLAASDPVTRWAGLRSWLGGFVMGLAGAPQPPDRK